MTKVLLIIDPQNDFVDKEGSLYIPNSEKAIDNIVRVIKNNAWDDIIVTLDTHLKYHIGHGYWWKENPDPFTKITYEDILNCKFNPLYPGKVNREELLDYFKKIKVSTVWPEHCIYGTDGWYIPNRLSDALKNWSFDNSSTPIILQKGVFPNKEMYSAFSCADGTELDKDSIDLLKNYDSIYISGFAKDVCVSYTVEDLMKFSEFKNKLIFLDNCMESIDPNSTRQSVFKDAIDNFNAKIEKL